MRIEVLKKKEGVSRIDYFSEEGKLVKTQIRDEWKEYGPISVPTRFTVEDHRTGSKTVLRLQSCKVNNQIPDSAFKKQALVRGD